jgi:hypothetical protein
MKGRGTYGICSVKFKRIDLEMGDKCHGAAKKTASYRFSLSLCDELVLILYFGSSAVPTEMTSVT